MRRAWCTVLAGMACLVGGVGHADHPEDAAWIERDARAFALYQQGHHAEAITVTEEALRQAVAAFGPESLSAAKYQHNLGQLYAQQHKTGEADLLFQRSLATVERVKGAAHPQVATVLESYARLKRMIGDAASAERFEARLQTVKSADSTRQTAWQQLAAQVSDLSGQGRYPEAIAVAQRAVSAAEAAFGPNDPRLSQSLSDLAELYRVTQDLDQAEALQKRSLEIRKKIYGERHPAVAASLLALGHIAKAQAKYPQALALYQRALAMDEQALGKKDFAVANDLNALAQLHVTQSQYAAAAPLYQRILAIIEAQYGAGHPDLVSTLELYAQCLRKAGKPREAEAAEARAASLREQAGKSPATTQ